MKKILLATLVLLLMLGSVSFAACSHSWQIVDYKGYNESVHKVVKKCSLCGEKSETKENHKYINGRRDCYRCGYSKDYGYNKPKSTPTASGVIAVSSISLSDKSITLKKVGSTRSLSATVKPDNATTKTVKWSSSNNAIAKVNSYGQVTAMGKGTCTITCKDSTGKVTATCSVTVGEVSTTKTPTKAPTKAPTATPTPSQAEATCKHKTKEWKVTKEATCNEKGVKSQVCKSCGKVFDTKSIAKLSHKYKWVVTKEATCTEKGSKEYRCSLCKNVSKTESIKALGHKYNKDGMCTRCKDCKHNKTGWTTTKEATCQSKGEEANICQVCKKTIETRKTAKGLHKFKNEKCIYCGKQQDNSSQYINVGYLIQKDKELIKKGTYSSAQWAQMEKELKLAIEEGGGTGTRGGLVAAAEYLASLQYRVPYSRDENRENPSAARRKWNKKGLNHSWGTSSWGLDCTGFVGWAHSQVGLKAPGIKAKAENWVGNYYKKIKPGDIFYSLGMRKNKVTGETSYTQNHIALVIEVNDEGFWIAESDTKRGGGVMTTFYSFENIKKQKQPVIGKEKGVFISPISSTIPEGNIRNLITNYQK